MKNFHQDNIIILAGANRSSSLYHIVSHRERQVLSLLSMGLSTEKIAQNLFVSKETIKSHRRSLLHKLDVRNAAQLVRRGFEAGLLQIISKPTNAAIEIETKPNQVKVAGTTITSIHHEI